MPIQNVEHCVAGLREEAADSKNPHFESVANLLERLHQELPQTEVWLFRSRDQFALVPESVEGAGKPPSHYVAMIHCSPQLFHFSYTPEDGKLPFARAEVTFYAQSLDEALANIKIALRETGAWKNSPDLP